MSTLPDMRNVADLDSATYHCPCGNSFSGGGYRNDDELVRDFEAWKAKHRPHTSGFCTYEVSADGARIYSSVPKPERKKF